MAGGEFRFGTDSIYMARHQHSRPHRTSTKTWITWLRVRALPAPVANLLKAFAIEGSRKLGLDCPPTGLLLVSNLNPQRQTSAARLDALIRLLVEQEPSESAFWSFIESEVVVSSV